MKLRYASFVLSLSVLVSSCGHADGPSDSDVDSMVRKDLKASLVSYMGSMLNVQSKSSLDDRVAEVSVAVGDKTKQADGSYIVIYTIKPPPKFPKFLSVMHVGETGTIHMLKGADGWVLEDDSKPMISHDE